MPEEFLKITREFFERNNIIVKDTDDKKEIKEAKCFMATFTPVKEKIIIK